MMNILLSVLLVRRNNFPRHPTRSLSLFALWNWPRHKKLVLLYGINNGADQPALPRSLISAFVIRISRKYYNSTR